MNHPIRRCATYAFAVACVLTGIGLVSPMTIEAQDNEPFLKLGKKRQIESAVLGEAREIIVGLPVGYDSSEESYPVIYLLDGPGHFHHTTGTARFLARNGRMPDALVVAISNTDRTRDLTPPILADSLVQEFPTAGGADNFLKFISTELMPFIDAEYRSRPYSILIGHSLGGLFANHVLVHHPDVFDAYISISPSLWWDNQLLVAQADSALSVREEWVGDLYMTMGNEGTDMLGGALKFSGVLEEKAPDSFRWEFKLMEEEDHGSVPHRSTYYGLEKIFDGWHLHDPVALYENGGIVAVDRYFERANKRFGYDRKVSNDILLNIGSRALRLEEAESAVVIFKRVLDDDSMSTEAHMGMADALDLLNQEDSAIEHYMFALKTDPKQTRAREKLTEYGVDLADFPEEVLLPIELLQSYEGLYSSEEDEFRIELDEEVLFLTAGSMRWETYALATDRFRIENLEAILTFTRNEEGQISGLTVSRSGATLAQARRVE